MELQHDRSERENPEDALLRKTPPNPRAKRWGRREIITIALTAGFAALGAGAAYQNRLDRIEAEETADAGEGLRDPDVLYRAEQIISSFENSDLEIKYAYAEELEDGRGITAGRAGFTSETGDLLQVVQVYAAMGNEDSQLVTEYLPELEIINEAIENDEEPPANVLDAEGFIKVWKETAKEQDLKEAQDAVYKELYLDPALRLADEIGIKSAAGQLIILDTIIQHGEGDIKDDIDGLPSIVQETERKFGKHNGNEVEWLEVFLDIREYHLMHAADPETRQVWVDSVDRVNALRHILKEERDLIPPIEWEVFGDKYSIED